MKKLDIKKTISKLPEGPGVYFFLAHQRGGAKGKKVLYVGKATSLRDRVRSYFNKDIVNTRSPLISKMLTEFDDIKFQETDSVLEALVLEANLIKKLEPEANIKEKDNKSFNYVVVTKEDFPRVLVMRGRELEKLFHVASFENHGNFWSRPKASAPKISSVRRRRSYRGFSQEDDSKSFSKDDMEILYLFGPFPNGSQLKEAVKIVRKMFPFRDKCTPTNFLRGPLRKKSIKDDTLGKPCFNRQIGLCPGVCTGEVSKREYAKTVKNIILFFESNKNKLVKNLEKQMNDFAKAKEFEKAQKIKKTLFTLNHIQDISLIKENKVSRSDLDTKFRIESFDIAHLSGTNVVGAMTVVEDGEVKKSDYRKFSARGGSAFGGKTVLGNSGIINDTKALKEVLSRRLAHPEWPEADLIVVDGGKAQKSAVEKVLKENNRKIPVVSVVKDERHKPKDILGSKKWLKWEREILLANAEAHRFAIGFHKKLRSKLI